MKRGQNVPGRRGAAGALAAAGAAMAAVVVLEAQPHQADADQRDHQHRGEHAAGVEILRRGHDQLAEPGRT
jgi:hypothetical protein